MSLRIAGVHTRPDSRPYCDAAVIYDSVTDTPMGRFFYDMVHDPDEEDSPFWPAETVAHNFLVWFEERDDRDLRSLTNGRICDLIDEYHKAELAGWQVA